MYRGLDCGFASFPADNVCDPKAYNDAIASMRKGDCVTIFTPDDTHFEIAMACVQKGSETHTFTAFRLYSQLNFIYN